MVTDWLRNPDVLLLIPLAAGFLCAVVLAATRRLAPPERPDWRLIRALVLVGMLSALGAVWSCCVAAFPAMAFPPTGVQVDRSLLARVTPLLGYGILLGGLIPTLIEGRSLREMGWHARRLRRYVPAGLIVGAVLGLIIPGPPDYQHVGGLVPETGTLLLIARIPAIPMVAVVLSAFVIAGWTEENVFRGHLLPVIQELGVSGWLANIVQALVFSAYHLPMWMAPMGSFPPNTRSASLWTISILLWFLWGMVFGGLRQRTGSIVPGFVLHGAHNSVYMLVRLGPSIVAAAGLGSR